MSERVVLLNHGRIVQDDPPQALFEMPARRFVADFMGIENVFNGTIVAVGEGYGRIAVADMELKGRLVPGARLAPGDHAFLAIRAERVRLLPGHSETSFDSSGVACRPRLQVYKGSYYDIELETSIGIVISRLWEPTQAIEGSYAMWRPEDCVIGPIDSESGESSSRP